MTFTLLALPAPLSVNTIWTGLLNIFLTILGLELDSLNRQALSSEQI